MLQLLVYRGVMESLLRKRSFIRGICNFFKYVYLTSAIIVILFVLSGLILAFGFNAPTRYQGIIAGGIVLVEAVLYLVWFKIFANLSKVFESSMSAAGERLLLRRTSVLLAAVFIVNIFDNATSIIFAPDFESVKWSAVHWPEYNQNIFEYLFGLLSMFFKLIHFWKHFLLPDVYGLGALVAALLLYHFSVKDDTPVKTDGFK